MKSILEIALGAVLGWTIGVAIIAVILHYKEGNLPLGLVIVDVVIPIIAFGLWIAYLIIY